MLIKDIISKIKPDKAIEIGCGCGIFTKEMSKFCKHITATDVSEKLINRCKEENSTENIEYLQMNAVMLKFKNDAFNLSFERASLHHIPDWQKALDEMTRVSSKHIIISEPLDDNRNIGKINNIRANRLHLEVEKEAGYIHFPHLTLEQFKKYFKDKPVKYNYFINKLNDLQDPDNFVESLEEYAKKTSRYDYWMKRFERFIKDLNGEKIAVNDILAIEITKNHELK